MASLKPRTKEGAFGISSAATIVLIYVGTLFGVVIPPEVAGAAVAIVGTIAARLKGEDAPDYKPKHAKEK